MEKAKEQIIELEAQRHTASDSELQRKFEQAVQKQQEVESKAEEEKTRNKELEAQLQSLTTQTDKSLAEKDMLIQDLQR